LYLGCYRVYLWIFMVDSLLYIWSFTTINFRDLSWAWSGIIFGHKVWENFFFLQILMGKRGQQYSSWFLKIYVHNLKKSTIDMNSSRKNTQFQKKRFIQNGVQEVEISLIQNLHFFRVFYGDNHTFCKLDIFWQSAKVSVKPMPLYI